jgi:hypothetical protein
MRYAVYAPILNDFSDPKRLVDLAVAAETARYDGFFIWDHLAIDAQGRIGLADATVTLGAIAQATERIKIGALITPLARRRPWKVAKEIVALDHLSGGRILFGAGLGEPAEIEFGNFGEDPAATARARKLDEGLAILDPLIRGETVTHTGDTYRLRAVKLAPRSVQSPRIPIWIAASLPATRGLERAAHWDGCFPVKVPASIIAGTMVNAAWPEWWLSPAELGQAVAYLDRMRGGLTDFAIAATGSTAADDQAQASAKVAAYATVGANWWLEWIDETPGSYAAALALVNRGPPR